MAASNTPNPLSSVSPSSRAPRWLFFVLIALCLLFVASYTDRLFKRAEVEAEIRYWEDKIEQERVKNLALQEELRFVAGPDFVDKVAREQLDMAKEGDTVLVVLEPTPAVLPAVALESAQANPEPAIEALPSESKVVDNAPAPEAPVAADDIPVWKQWLSIFAPTS